MDYEGQKSGGGAGQPKEKRENSGLVRAKNKGQGRPTLGKERKRID